MPGTVTRVTQLHDGPKACNIVTIRYSTSWERAQFGSVVHQLNLCPEHDRILNARARDLARTTGEAFEEVREQLHHDWRDRYVREHNL